LADLAGTGAVLGVATGKGRRGLDKVIARHGLDGMFTTIQTGDVPPGKPHPAMLLRAIDEVCVEPHETAMIGDTTFDMAMAVAAGALPVAVAWGYHPVADLVAAGAAHVAEDADGLATLLKRLLTP
jgi:phosphoglycolate phosphatase